MTVLSSLNRKDYNGDGVTTDFAFPSLFFKDEHLVVIETVVATGVETQLTLNTHYTVAGAGNEAGGTVTLLAAPATGTRLTILPQVPATQESDFIANDPLPAETLEQGLDLGTMRDQQLAETDNRSLHYPRGDVASAELVSAAARANMVLGFDAAGAPAYFPQDNINDGSLTLVTATGGTTARAIADFHGDYITVKDFGAKGDGAADDAAAFAAADASGKQVFVPAGAYKLGSAVAVTASAWEVSPLATFTGAGSFDYERGFNPDLGNGANIWRVRDRLFVGDAVAATGNWNEPRGGAWLVLPADGADWAIRDATILAMSPNGKGAIAGMTKSGQNTDGVPVPIGVGGYAINDRAAATVWGLYSDIQHEAGANQSFGLEVAAKNKGPNLSATPYNIGGGVFGLWLSGGGDNTTGGVAANPSNAAIVILKNAHTWNKGIVFEKDALTGSDGTTGAAVAMQMAAGQALQWLGPGGIAGARVVSSVITASSDVSLIFSDNGFSFIGANGTTSGLAINVTPSAVNRFRLRSQVAGVPPSLEADGADANIAINLIPKGTGGIQIAGTQVLTTRRAGWAAATGSATRTTFATGSVTLPVLAEHVKALIDDFMTHGAIGA